MENHTLPSWRTTPQRNSTHMNTCVYMLLNIIMKQETRSAC